MTKPWHHRKRAVNPLKPFRRPVGVPQYYFILNLRITNMFFLFSPCTAPSDKNHGESEGRFEISELHQNPQFFSSSLGEEQNPDTASDGFCARRTHVGRSHSASDIRTTTNSRCPPLRPSLELESHECTNCVHELVEDMSQGPPTRTLLRLQSLGTDYGSDEFGGCTSSEEAGHSKDEESHCQLIVINPFYIYRAHLIFYSEFEGKK